MAQRIIPCQICLSKIKPDQLLVHVRLSDIVCTMLGDKTSPPEDRFSFEGLLKSRRPCKKIICTDCAEKVFKMGVIGDHSPMKLQCSGCKRQVLLVNKKKVPKYTWCCEPCRNAHRYKKREKSSRKTINIPPPRQCSQCPTLIPSPRPGQTACSNACRQKAYRDRKKINKAKK